MLKVIMFTSLFHYSTIHVIERLLRADQFVFASTYNNKLMNWKLENANFGSLLKCIRKSKDFVWERKSKSKINEK